jgi:type I restriction enzyme, S subunit
MKNGWPIKTLGDVCERVTVGHVGITSPYYRDEGILFLRTQNVGTAGLVLDDRKYVTPEFHTSLKKSEVKAGDILMSRVITHTVHCALIPHDLGPANCANVVLVRPASGLLPEFLAHYIHSSVAQRHLLDRKVGSAQLVVNTTVVKNWPIPVPPLPEQQRIVGILDEAFESIATAKANAEKNLQNSHALFEIHLQSVFTQRGPGWAEKPLGDVCSFENGDRGANYPSKSARTATGIPFINAGHLTEDGIDLETMDYISRERFDLLSNGKIRRGDILFCLRGSLGKFASVGDLSEGAIASSLVIVRPDKTVLNEYLVAYFRSPICSEMINRFKNGAAQPNLSAQSLSKFIAPIPPLPEQRLLVEEISDLRVETQRLVSIYQQKLVALEALKKSLLHQAFTGQLRNAT